MFRHIKNFAANITKRTRVPASFAPRMHPVFVSVYVSQEAKCLTANLTSELVFVFAVHHVHMTCQIGHKSSAHVTIVLHSLVFHLLVHLHLRSVAAGESTHITFERSLLGVLLLNMD